MKWLFGALAWALTAVTAFLVGILLEHEHPASGTDHGFIQHDGDRLDQTID